MVVEYLEGRPRSELNQDTTEHQHSKAILTPLLSVSECWRAAALSSICDHCELTFDHRHQVTKVTIPALPADFSYRGFRQAPLVKRVMVTANLWRDMCDGAFCKTMSTVLYESLLFPSASVLWVCLDEDKDEDYDSDSDSDSDSEITQEQVTRFSRSLLKLVPNATCVAVKLLVINNSVPNYRQLYDVLILELCYERVSKLDVYSDQDIKPLSLGLHSVCELSRIFLGPAVSCAPFVHLAYRNAGTLEVLDIERVEESDWRNLIYGSTDVPATYTNLTYFDIHILDVPYSSTWAAIADTTPFPILSSLGIYDYYPFDDDVLFRGNGGTLQYLCIPFSALARSVFGRFDIFKRSGVRRMNRISIGKVTNEDDAFLEGNADGHIGRSLQRVYEVAATLRVKNDSSERHMFNALKSAPRLANIQHLYFSRETFKLDDLVCLVAALPSLVSISCTVSGIGPEIEAISEDKRPSSLRTKHYPLSNNFRKLRILNSSNIPTQDIAYIGMLLAVLCPKFGHVDLSSELRYMFNREIAWAMINDPFRPYSSCLERLVYR
ncbi:hypothetical protein GGH94_005406 [Coemansia aciculifera]|uniref:Uncharacterized protein n=1 Tax=Coemansia aciculifera TaxID=417176 RepID=A0A9W8III9_9FUNG|nr:hypothetical protein GGH94_005406 [Coemansia aciculifera]